MSALSIAALVAATASIVTTGCVTYIVISFRRSADLIASRAGRRPRALVLVAAGRSHRPRMQPRPAPVRVPVSVRLT